LYGLIEKLECFFVPSLTQQRRPETREIFRLRLKADSVGDPLYGLIQLLRLRSQQTHKVQRVSVTGILRERLPTASLRIEISTFLHVAEAGFILRASFARLHVVRSFLKSPDGC
jgi:hypothetical protein